MQQFQALTSLLSILNMHFFHKHSNKSTKTKIFFKKQVFPSPLNNSSVQYWPSLTILKKHYFYLLFNILLPLDELEFSVALSRSLFF